MKRISLFFISLAFMAGATAQLPKTYTSSEIFQQIKKLKVLGSVLYVAAHPDDENTRLIAWLANGQLYRTGYLSLTRGDGGQNLIGNEQGTELGLIRTQELLAARRIDGGEQFFSRAYDFGFSKSTDEALNTWERDKVLSDVVWVIRKFQPDVIITRFPPDSRAGHGHHSGSAVLAAEAFDAAADPNRFPDQLAYGVKPWKAKRLLWNTFNFGSANTIDSTQFSLDAGGYNALQGLSFGELAGESRSQHKSQGFGVSRQRGSSKEYFSLTKGEPAKESLLDGVNTSWNRIEGGGAVEAAINAIITGYNAEDPAASIPALRKLSRQIKSLPESVWQEKKLAEIDNILLACAGIYIEATVSSPAIIPGDSTVVTLNAINRSNAPCKFYYYVEAGNSKRREIVELKKDELFRKNLVYTFKNGKVLETQPYWLRRQQSVGMFDVSDQQLIGLPEEKGLTVLTEVGFDSSFVWVQQPIQYRYVDPVKGEQYNPVYFTNPYLIYSNPGVLLLRKDQKDSATLEMRVSSLHKAAADKPAFSLTGTATRYKQQFPQPAMQWVTGEEKIAMVKIPNYLKGTGKESDLLSVSFLPGGAFKDTGFYNSKRTIEYDHIPTQNWHYVDNIKVLHIDLKTVGMNIGYIPGAGDKVVPALQQMGYVVTILKPEDITLAHIKSFDAIITGVRAYNVHEWLSDKYDVLMQYVKAGGNLIVQYNTNSNVGPVKAKISPYPMNVGRNRITDETAKVDFLLPNHSVLNFPNKITSKDFDGWIQERSIYHADQLDSRFITPLSMADPNEQPSNGALAIAPYGKGNFVYTGIVFFRELPAGVAGAYRLLANIIALPKNGN